MKPAQSLLGAATIAPGLTFNLTLGPDTSNKSLDTYSLNGYMVGRQSLTANGRNWGSNGK